ncbi:MAG: biotin--[acetyl-CoA-carboxylase] ligase [Rhodospirillales bacterium]|nr:biotin--[acetyl-CoA-carboxylase] ligase [Rhodospirillales bacterium]
MTEGRHTTFRLSIHDSLPSTSDLCRARALDGEPDGLAVLARRQTRGRGTNGRAWQSPEGNLYLSVLLRPQEEARDTGQWSLLAAVALAESLAPLLPDPRALTLKWPNDALLHGRKLAGILTEAASGPDGMLSFLVVGMGVNLAVAPRLPDRPTACLAEVVPPPAPEAFARQLLSSLQTWREVRARDGFARVRDAWLARGPRPAAPLQVRLGATTAEGGFAGLGPDGSLLLATAAGIRTFVAGEVVTPQPGGA